jgi:hypothetical protein
MSLVRFISQIGVGLVTGIVVVGGLFFFCWLLAAGCSRAHVSVSNQSGTTVSNLVISGSCKERRTDSLATQSEWRTVTPYHSGLMHFSFDCAGMSYSTNTELGSAFVGVFYTISSNMIVIIQKKG